ncbi:MAG TPA: hypothetical protein PLQ97_03220 [Myxococcota bacterium]|nr:hypothetical protein [Myxococcota bacterium]HQK51815.1 hypothetical protein [Myxococcota bacterium]
MYVDPNSGQVLPDQPSTHPLIILYRMTFQDGRQQTFRVVLDRVTLALLSWPVDPPPDWARLENHRCRPCPLDPRLHSHCPAAVALADLAAVFKNAVSWTPVDLWVETEHRNYQRQTNLQKAVSSLAGIYMTTAGCPVLDRMRPLVQTHLPLQSQFESTQRFLSLFLFEQWARERQGLPFEWNPRAIQAYLEEVSLLNGAFAERLGTIPGQRGDTTANAVVILDSLAMATLASTETTPFRNWTRLLHTRRDADPFL